MKKVLSIIFVILFVVVMITNLLFIFNIPFLGVKAYKVGSGSMNPYLKVNDIVIVKSQKKYKKNDVITYKNEDNETITHRIIKLTDNKIITKGDANNMEDTPIEESNIIGKVLFKISFLGFIFYLFNKPFFWLLLFIFGIITLIINSKKETV